MQAEATESAPGEQPRWLILVLCCLLVTVTAVVFWPAVGFRFLTYDDHDYVTGNPVVQQGLTWDTVRWAFTTQHASNWHPLTWLSHAWDCQLFGLQPAGHHRVNVLLHAFNSALLFVLLSTWTGFIWRNLCVAAVFALHPLRVESVAWVAERKDLLSAMFFFLVLLTYTRYAARQQEKRPSRHGWYVTALLLFALGLLSKPTLVTVPFLLLLLDAWPLQRWAPFSAGWFRSLFRLMPEKLPFLLLAIASCAITYSVQKAGHAVREYSLETRLANVPVAYVKYLAKLVYPADLAVIYPFRQIAATSAWGAALLLGIITFVVIRLASRHRYLFTGWFWFIGMLVPMIGIVQVGNQALADRYTYLPAIGVTIAVVWGAMTISRRFQWPVSVWSPVMVAALTGLVLVTHQYLPKWNNTIDLFKHAVRVTLPHTVALKNMGMAYLEQRQWSDAQRCFEESLTIEPNDQPTLFNLGSVLLQQGRPEEAAKYLRPALSVPPGFAQSPAYLQIAILLAETNQPALAAEFYQQTLVGDPNSLTALNNLAWLRATDPRSELRNGVEAVQLATRACELTRRRIPTLLGTLAVAYAEAGRFAEAIAAAEEAQARAREAKDEETAKRNGRLVELFKAGKVVRDDGTPL